MQRTAAPNRYKPRCAAPWFVRLGVMVCGVAGGLVELLALQRSRLQHRPRSSKSVWHR